MPALMPTNSLKHVTTQLTGYCAYSVAALTCCRRETLFQPLAHGFVRRGAICNRSVLSQLVEVQVGSGRMLCQSSVGKHSTECHRDLHSSSRNTIPRQLHKESLLEKQVSVRRFMLLIVVACGRKSKSPQATVSSGRAFRQAQMGAIFMVVRNCMPRSQPCRKAS